MLSLWQNFQTGVVHYKSMGIIFRGVVLGWNVRSFSANDRAGSGGCHSENLKPSQLLGSFTTTTQIGLHKAVNRISQSSVLISGDRREFHVFGPKLEELNLHMESLLKADESLSLPSDTSQQGTFILAFSVAILTQKSKHKIKF